MKKDKIAHAEFNIGGTTTGRIKMKKDNGTLGVTTVFLSVDGEVNPKGQGVWSVFLRLSGCTAGCTFCDTTYSWKEGDRLLPEEITRQIQNIGRGVKKITITGGEPLEQQGRAFTNLIQILLSEGYYITIETNGLHKVDDILKTADYMGRNQQLSIILDWKLGSAGKVSEKVSPSVYMNLPRNCFVKFVVSDRADFNEAITAADFIRKTSGAKIYFSPCEGGIKPSELFSWMKESVCPTWGIGFNLQLHKFIFSDDWREEEG